MRRAILAGFLSLALAASASAQSIYNWSTTAGSNATADSGINMAEGMLPSAVNDGVRVLMARVAAWIKDQGSLSLSGTNTLTVTANSGFTAYATGRVIVAKVANDNTGAATLNVNSIGAKAVKKIAFSGEADVASGDMQAGQMAVLVYDAAANSSSGAWILLNPTVPVAGTDVQAYREELTKVNAAGSNIASATNIDIGAATGDFVTITGTTTIESLGTVAAGTERTLVFAGALTLTHNGTSLILPGGANITTAAGDVAVARSLGSGNWRVVNYSPASGGSVSSAAAITSGTISGVTISSSDISGEIQDDATFEDASATRTALGLGSSATVATGTSGATVPLLNGNNTYSGTASFTGTRQTFKLASFGSAVSHTITSGVISLTASHVSLVGEGDTTDSLGTINGGAAGDFIVLRNSNAYTITVIDSASIELTGGTSFAMNNARDIIGLFYTGAVWVEMFRADNG